MNKPFDQRVINELERPTSSDLNIAQSQLNLGSRALMRQMLQQNPAVVGKGSLGESFFVEKIAGEDRKFKIKRGVGFNYAAYNTSTDLNIDGITGLSDPFDYRMVSLQSDEGVPFDVELGPGAGLCRRDVIAIRCTNPSANQLVQEDYTDTDIYDPTLNKFIAVSKPKTFSYDLTGSVPQVLDYDQINLATDAVVYIKGQPASYTGPDSLLDAPATFAGDQYLNIAFINVVQSLPTVEQSDVADFRRLVAPQGNLVVSGSATIGSNGAVPGDRLEGVTLKTPPGIKAQLWKVAEGTSNSYALAVYGPRNVTASSLTIQRGDTSAVYAALKSNTAGFSDRPLLLVSGPQELNGVVNNAAKTLAASASASPTQQVAIGQPYHVFPFTLCRVDNVTSTVTKPVTITGSINIDPIPPSSADAWPAGTYNVDGHTNYRTFYLQAGTAPSSPVSNIDDPKYLLSNTLNAEAEQIIEANDIGTDYERVVGFLADAQTLTWDKGVWRLPMAAIGMPFSGTGFGLSTAVAIVRAYRYNGTDNPENPAYLIESSQEVVLPQNSANMPEFVEFFIPEIPGGNLTTSRLYLALFVKKVPTSIYPASARFYFNYAPSLNVSFLETNILAAAPTITIPNKADRWPAGVDLAGSFSADPFNVELNVAGAEQRLNPAAISLANSTSATYSGVSITFTLNLTVE